MSFDSFADLVTSQPRMSGFAQGVASARAIERAQETIARCMGEHAGEVQAAYVQNKTLFCACLSAAAAHALRPFVEEVLKSVNVDLQVPIVDRIQVIT